MRRDVRRIRRMIFVVAAVQAVDGALIAGTCLCSPSLTTVGAALAFMLAAIVAGFCGLGFLVRFKARTAACLAALLEAGVLLLMGHPNIAASPTAWAVQLPALLLVAAVVVLAFRERSRAVRGTGDPPRS